MVSALDCYAEGLPFKSHPISAETCMWGTVTGCHTGYREVDRCHTRGESHRMYTGVIQFKVLTILPILSS